MIERLRLRAVDAEDLQIVAACLQDALVPLSEMAFLVEERCFLAAFCRFCRESADGPERCDNLAMRQSVLRIDEVEAVRYRGLDRDTRGLGFELLTLMVEPEGDILKITLIFAGDAAIQLDVGRIAVRLDDFGETWPADVAPRHELPDASSGE